MTGVDIYSGSHGNGQPVDWDRVASAAEFVIVKLTEGTTYLNPYAVNDILESVSRKLVTMAYHFPAYGDPVAEADYFVHNLPIAVSRVPVWLDLENPPNRSIPWDQVSSFAAGFIERCKGYDLHVGVYCNVDFYRNLPWLADFDLWLADPSNVAPQVARKLTQFDIGSFPGFPVAVDLDRISDYDWFNSLKGSAMADDMQGASEFIEWLYRSQLGRASDPGGVHYWWNLLKAGASYASVFDEFVATPEAVAYRDMLAKAGWPVPATSPPGRVS